jgi:glycosyltransferase involved in cell wall biosynthesis
MKVLYVIPCNKVGGAETVFNSVVDLRSGKIEIVKLDLNLYSNNPVLYIKAFFKVFRTVKNEKVEFIISTLWKSHFIMIMVSIFTTIKVVPFIVGTKFFNALDKLFSTIVIRNSDYLLVDSRKGELWVKTINPSCKIYSFLIHTQLSIDKNKLDRNTSIGLNFIYVGRLNVVKRLDKVFEFVNLLNFKFFGNITFDFYGPLERGFDLDLLLNSFKHLNVSYKGIIKHSEFPLVYPKYNFFIQFSDSEGSGMSIIEAMRFGLIPVITKVGEVVEYCIDGENSILFETDEKPEFMIDHFSGVISRVPLSSMSNSALATFSNVTIFNDLLLEIIFDIYQKEYGNT